MPPNTVPENTMGCPSTRPLASSQEIELYVALVAVQMTTVSLYTTSKAEYELLRFQAVDTAYGRYVGCAVLWPFWNTANSTISL